MHLCVFFTNLFYDFTHDYNCYISVFQVIIRRRQWHPTPVLLPGKSHGQRSLVGYSPWSRKESDLTELLHFHFSLSCTGEENGNPLQYCCLENPRDGSLVGCSLWGWTESDTNDVTQQQVIISGCSMLVFVCTCHLEQLSIVPGSNNYFVFVCCFLYFFTISFIQTPDSVERI